MILDGYQDSVCELKTMSNYLITTGYISKVTAEYIEISNKYDIMPIIPCDNNIKVSVLNEKFGFQVVVGSVYVSNKNFMRLIDVSSITEFEKRGFFRIEILEDCVVSLLLDEYETIRDGKPVRKCAERFVAIAVNVSLGGVMLRSDRRLELGVNLAVKLNMLDNILDFPCVIVRKRQINETLYEYGCEFVDCTRRYVDILNRYIFMKQREQIRGNV